MIVYSHHFFAMHTRFAMVLPGTDDARGDELARGVKERIEHWEQCLSGFRSGAELQLINELASKRELLVSESMARVLDLCDYYNTMTGALFDPAVSGGKSSWSDVIWKRESRSIRFARSGVRLDMGGIGKGVALDEVVAYLRTGGVKDAFLSFGESSIAGMGKHPHGDGWKVGAGEAFLLRNEFISASGLQDLQGSAKDESGAHIYHPKKGELIRSRRGVMVKCDTAVEAEVLSTCAYMADKEEFEHLKSQFPSAEWRLE